ncbi:hypothetical protein PTSG_13013 [Salpingoeca rosetta]|uniref:Uncharacterized protein n=1 Tax=Salpingoeca rosetta (strain ATCC 50818 / BSB-021) TaxID=946362 RepID=F2UQS9_SALR5|nr:uncharacterized protein PTSG_13013 [Salpingoeca rosetta]EGD79984.1 hypothetical protein PTSG_13013 [Salpingoeca rosetta]|eukprot:XP_004988605.1 hypothetical protein PTSG_13013 [Salpingoeca rosetta]
MLASARTHVVVSREQLEFLQEAGKRHAPCQHFSYLIKTLDTFETRAKDIDSHQFAHVAAWHDAIELFRRLLALLTEVAQSKQFHTHEKRAFLWFCFNSHRFIPDASLRPHVCALVLR